MADASTSGASERHSALPKTGCTGRPNDRVARTARRVTVALAVVYPIALLLFAAGLRFGGERWWLTTVVLYLPRIGFALPLPLLTVALVVIRAYSLLATQATALAILLFPLMGLELGGSSSRNDSGVRLRIMTMNIALGMDGIERVVELVRGAEADIVVLEEVGSENVEPLKAGLSDYTVRSVDQFIVASRLPIGQLSGPPSLLDEGFAHSAHYARGVVITAAGPLRIYAIHPTSPHSVFDELRGDGLLHQIGGGSIFRAPSDLRLLDNAALRVAQVRKVAEEAQTTPGPVILAGDTNLPGLSYAFARWLGGFHDAFAEAGRGFGYTYPAHHHPWMRIDRILGGPGVRFLDAKVLPEQASTHLAVIAELELR